jgi:hypothetical protein
VKADLHEISQAETRAMANKAHVLRRYVLDALPVAALLEQQIRSGNKVVVVAHSHGNNVTDRALRILENQFPTSGSAEVVTQDQAFGAIGVVMTGSPRSTMYRVSVPPNSVVKWVESMSKMSPARSSFGGNQPSVP